MFSGSNQSNPAKVSFKDSELEPLVGQDSKLVAVDKHGRPICVYVVSLHIYLSYTATRILQAKQTKLMASALSQLDQIETSRSRTARIVIRLLADLTSKEFDGWLMSRTVNSGNTYCGNSAVFMGRSALYEENLS